MFFKPQSPNAFATASLNLVFFFSEIFFNILIFALVLVEA